ncbi:MAG: phosphatase PAP2 family protein [Gemmatimonadota bacterium]
MVHRVLGHRYLQLQGVGGIVLATLLLCAFAALARAIPERGATVLDAMVVNWMNHHQADGFATFFTWVSWLGDTALTGLLAVAVVILIHRRRWAAAATIPVASIGGMYLDIALKTLFHRGRPDAAVEFIAGTTWSFPSGHSMASLVGYGIVAYFRFENERNTQHQLRIVLSTCSIVAAVGLSRLYLGVHYISDVLGGFLAGAIWLLLCIEGYRLVSSRWLGRQTDQQSTTT